VLGASGGAGASTLCALVATALGTMADRPITVLDLGGTGTTWLDWTTTPSGCSATAVAAGELAGTPVVTVAAGGVDQIHATDASAVTIVDVGVTPSVLAACSLRELDAQVLLVVRGTVDGIAAAQRAIHGWDAAGLPPPRLRPVVVVSAPGDLPPRARARLTLLDSDTHPVLTIPFDRAIHRRGLAEALASRTVSNLTSTATTRLLRSLTPEPSAAATPGFRLVPVTSEGTLR
jgi:hypothetical protein